MKKFNTTSKKKKLEKDTTVNCIQIKLAYKSNSRFLAQNSGLALYLL